jgi:hypothetical protein
MSDIQKVESLKQRRDDARAYVLLFFQILTFILTTITIIIGWGAKDYIIYKYDMALMTTSPTLYHYQNSDGRDSNDNNLPLLSYEKTNSELKLVGQRFRKMVWTSPTTSFLLCVGLFFIGLLFGILIVVVYILQRRRYRAHFLENQLGMDRDVPIYDPVLTISSVNILIYILASFLIISWFLVTWQCFSVLKSLYYDPDHSYTFTMIAVIAAWSLPTAKVVVDIIIGYLTFRYRREADWERRWYSLQSFETDIIKKKYILPRTARQYITQMREAVDITTIYPWKRHFIRRSIVEPTFELLIRSVIDADSSSLELWVRLYQIGRFFKFNRKICGFPIRTLFWPNKLTLYQYTKVKIRNEWCSNCQSPKFSLIARIHCWLFFRCWSRFTRENEPQTVMMINN